MRAQEAPGAQLRCRSDVCDAILPQKIAGARLPITDALCDLPNATLAEGTAIGLRIRYDGRKAQRPISFLPKPNT